MASEEAQPSEEYCYCKSSERDHSMLQCQHCKKYFHIGCLKSGRPSELAGDVFFDFTCTDCSSSNEEEFDRVKLSWQTVIQLALYNLHLTERGKWGYFRWKEHICVFIDKHWNVLFGSSRKRTSTWQGTVAGALSAGCPQLFVSGMDDLKESGWWKLAHNQPPQLDTAVLSKLKRAWRMGLEPVTHKVEGLRSRRSTGALQAAIALRAKRDLTQDSRRVTKKGKDQKASVSSSSTSTDPTASLSKSISAPSLGMSEADGALSELSSQKPGKPEEYFTEKDLWAGENLPEFLLKDDDHNIDSDSDFEVDPCSLTPPEQPSSPTDGLPLMDDIMANLHVPAPGVLTDVSLEASLSSISDVIKTEPLSSEDESSSAPLEDSGSRPVPSFSGLLHQDMMERPQLIKKERRVTAESESDSDSGSDSDTSQEASVKDDAGSKKAKRKRTEEDELKENEQTQVKRYTPMSSVEEKQLLRTMKSYQAINPNNHQVNRLKCQLMLRQLKRERGLPLFDLDAQMRHLVGTRNNLYGFTMQPHIQDTVNFYNQYNHGLPTSRFSSRDIRILDRFQLPHTSLSVYSQQHVSFLNRLVGTEDDQLQPIRSPYTARMLKPFIRRDYETKPMKLKLLEEIQNYYRKKNGEPPSVQTVPIDYCYVRPQHIPSVNTLAREFFWPGIDLSECLQYPDFSCVVLYRKVVIGFSFMVPDVAYNQAYISFIFTHPEWRGAGIAKFMLYHLIQTCMGKDVTLHVSASNNAMVLYQKFGFKPEELLLDFYDKYFPEDSKECKHAFFLRLRR